MKILDQKDLLQDEHQDCLQCHLLYDLQAEIYDLQVEIKDVKKEQLVNLLLMTLEILDQEIEVLEDLLVEKDHQVLHHLLVGEYHQGGPRGDHREGHQGDHQGDHQEDPQEDPQGGLQGGPELVQGPQVLGMVSNDILNIMSIVTIIGHKHFQPKLN